MSVSSGDLMKDDRHQKKPLTQDAAVFFKRLFPCLLFVRINKVFGLDKHTQKLRFRSFCLFLIAVIIFQPQDVSLRGLANSSQKQGVQILTGQESVSHTAIAERLKQIPTESLEMVLNTLILQLKKRLKYKSRTLRQMKVFDVTNFSVSEKHYQWAAKRQSRRNIRFLFVMDCYSGAPDTIIDASKNLNDNTVFQEAISSAKRGKILVFDKGFNRFSCFKQILEAQMHFITRWKKNYEFNHTYTRKINVNERLEKDWILKKDDIGYIGVKKDDTGICVRKIECWNPQLKKTFTILTSERNLAPNKLVQMYVYRWPIEVLFRHIKSTMNVIHFPSRDPQGVHNWMLFIVLSILCIENLTLKKKQDHTTSLMMRGHQFKTKLRETQLIFHHWMLELAVLELS